jgi:hypothetical protein
MSAEMYTREQIFCAIRIIWREALGYEEPLDLDMRFYDDFRGGGLFDEIDFGDVIFRVQRELGFTCALEEWKTFLGTHIQDADIWERDIAPRLTFRALADFIRERLEPITLEAITLLGKPCRTAGIFRALERLVGEIHPAVIRFGPSTPIRSRLRGSRLHRLWDRLRWMTQERIPLPYRIKLGCGGFYFKIGIGLLIALWKRDLEGLWLSLKVTTLLFLPTAFLVEFLNSQLNPLPTEIKTFGDLARYLAAIIVDQQTEAASCSTP